MFTYIFTYVYMKMYEETTQILDSFRHIDVCVYVCSSLAEL